MRDNELKDMLSYTRTRTLGFSEFVEEFLSHPDDFLHTSATLLSEAIKFFGFKIVVRSGEPTISYAIFNDIFNGGTKAVFGQEFAIKHIVDAIESAARETGPHRGLVLVGPPASGKTNVIDIMADSLEEYTKRKAVKLYSFFFEFSGNENKRTLELWNSFRHNPLLLFPIVVSHASTSQRPRQQLFNHLLKNRDRMAIPTYYQNASLDKCSLDIIDGLMQNPLNREKTLFDIFERYVRIEEIVFSNGQARGISNIDDMGQLRVRPKTLSLSSEDKAILDYHLPGFDVSQYDGALVRSNRGLLHIHDGFTGDKATESDYRPLLMLLGSGKVSIDATQASIDTTVVMTTNLEEMKQIETQITSAKLMDRIEKIPVNYLLDANSEMEILKRDLAIMKENYDVDPNLLRIASYYAVLTRLLPPMRDKYPQNWSVRKQTIYNEISVEKKLFIYAYRAEDPLATIAKLPHWHPFRNEALKLGLSLDNSESLQQHLDANPDSISLHASGLFTNEELTHIDDEFMRELWREHYPIEGRSGMSVRQLQNIMRNTIANSDGHKVHVGTFLSQLKRVIREGHELHHWLRREPSEIQPQRKMIPSRKVGNHRLGPGEGDFRDAEGLVKVVKFLYYNIIEREITQATVDRNPAEIESDLRRYIQYCLLSNATENKAFAHIMIPKFSFIHPTTGEKVDHPDFNYMASIEKVVAPTRESTSYRREIAHKFMDMQSSGEVLIEEGKNVISSRGDNILVCFHDLYQRLLSHRRTVEGINAELLRDAFFQKKNNERFFKTYSQEIQGLVKNILDNMTKRFGYSETIALDTIVFALRKSIVDFTTMIT